MPESEKKTVSEHVNTFVRGSVLSPRILKFGIVGSTGVVVNMFSLYLLTEFARIPILLGSPIAIELSILSNFWMNVVWTWRDRSGHGTILGKLARYHIAMGITAFFGNYLILIALTHWLGLHYMISNLIGIGVSTIANYAVNDLWTFKKLSKPA